MKIVVFDLDETLGYFTQFGVFWDCVQRCIPKADKQEDFDALLDLYPEFLRPNIMNILEYLRTKKDSACCHRMMIYTNNNGPREWAQHILRHFENKLGSKIIDQIIAAFKVNGKCVELNRTTHQKTYKDLIRCTKLPAHAEICFLDDTYHPGMVHDSIYYIHIKPFYRDLSFEVMLNRLSDSAWWKDRVEEDKVEEKMNQLKTSIDASRYDVHLKSEQELEIDRIVGRQIIRHLQDFFKDTKKNRTLRQRKRTTGTRKVRSKES